MGALERLKDQWREDIRPVLDPTVEEMQAGENPATLIEGIGRTGDHDQPCVVVTEDSHRGEAIAYAEERVGEEVAVRVRAPLGVPPQRTQAGWGEENAYEGRLVGGKGFHRPKDGRRVGNGTLSFVARNRRGKPVLVGNHHCLTPEEGSRAEEERLTLHEVEPHQKAVNPASPFGRIVGWKQLTTDHDRFENDIDAAIAHPSEAWAGETEVGVIGDFGQIDRVGEPRPGDEVTKNGATTGVTEGTVELLDTSTKVRYDSWGKGERSIVLDHCYEVQPVSTPQFSQAGDSGSPVVRQEDDELVLLGIHFAGNEEDGTGTFCLAKNVLDAFDLKL